MPKTSRDEREKIAETRLLRVVGSHGTANARTLEQKISDAGPYNQRIHPHVLTSVRNRLVRDGSLVRRRPPSWAIEVLQEALRSKANSMLELAEELEAEKK